MSHSKFSKGALRLYFLCSFFAIGSFIWGYNIGIIATVYTHPGFKKKFHSPDGSKTGLITSIYYLGTWTSYLFLSHPASDYLGRKWAVFLGAFIVCIGAAFQAGARVLAMMVIGRILTGMGVAIVSSTVAIYQSEVAPARQRGLFVVMNHIGLVAGVAAAFWVGYAMTFWETPRGKKDGWRLSIALQYVPAVIFFLGLPFLIETPRWLLLKGKTEEGRRALAYVREGSYSESEIDAEFEDIKASVNAHKAEPAKWTHLFTHPELRQSLWRASLLHFMAQASGGTSIKYSLPTLFKLLGLGYRLTLLVSGIESTLKIAFTITEMLVIDKVGRRFTVLFGITVMFFAMLINGALPLAYPKFKNHAADYACIVFIFLFGFGFSLSLGPLPWVYGSEIFPTKYRALGLNFAASNGALGSILTSNIWPVGIKNIGSKTYFIFMAINLVCLPIIYIFYPETKKQSLEGLESLFKDGRPNSAEEHYEADAEYVHGGSQIPVKGV